MPWYIWLTIALSAALAALFIALSLILRKTGGYAPRWQIRCTSCGRTRDAAEAGIVRVGAASYKKWILGRCSSCGKLRMLALERKPQPPPDAPRAQ